MPQFVEWREDGNLRYTAGAPETLQLSRGTLIREMNLRLQMQPTSTAGNNAAANVQWGGPWGVIRQIDLVVNGSDSILTLAGADLTRMHYYHNGQFPDVSDILGDGVTANPALDVNLMIPFWMPRASKAIDTVLDARRLASLDLRVQWGDWTNVISAATGWTAAPVLTVNTLRSSGQVAANAQFTEWRRYAVVADATVTNAQQRINLATGVVYRGMFFNVYDSNTLGDSAANNALNRIRVKSGATVFADLRAETLRNWTRQRYGLHIDSLPDVASDGDNDVLNNWYYLDFVTDGRLRESIDTASYSEFFCELDVVGAANQQVRVLPQVLIPPRRSTR